MKKLALCVAVSLAFCGCSPRPAAENDSGDPSGSSDKPRIALIMKSLANEFFSTMAAGAEKYQAEHPDQFDLVVNGIKDERDLSRQVALVEEMIAANVDAIVIAPADSKALIPALRRARKAGVIVVNIDNRLDADILQIEEISIPFVGPDNQSGAKKVADYLAGKLSPGDSVGVLEGVRTSFNGQQRFAGFQASMQAAELPIVDHQSAEWEMSKANTIASSMLSEHPEIKAILAANDSMALGAVAAVKSAGRTGDVLVVGFDNISAVRQAIEEDKILATADQHGDQLAVYGIQTALIMLRQPQAQIDDVETPVDLVTKESLTQ
ncbi:MAG: sugar ABC transporter substrate-binding protein [Blastopirellula sp. JB062]